MSTGGEFEVPIGVEIDGVHILRSRQWRGITKTPEPMIKQRSAIEPAIKHMKRTGGLGRDPLKDAPGDALYAVMWAPTCGLAAPRHRQVPP